MNIQAAAYNCARTVVHLIEQRILNQRILTLNDMFNLV